MKIKCLKMRKQLDLIATCQRLTRHLELSEYESKVYVCIIVEGVSGAGKISTRSGVPRTKVYGTLRRLIERGLVFEVSGEPRKYAPTSPSKAFEQYLSHFRDTASERVTSLVQSQEVVSVLETAYEEAKSINDPQKEDVWIFHNWPTIIRKMKEMLNQAEKTVTVTTNESGLVFFYRITQKLLDKLVERNVKVRVAVPDSPKIRGLVRELRYICRIKEVNVASPFLYVSVDGKSFLLVKLNLKGIDRESENNNGLACYSSTISGLFSNFVEGLVGIKKNKQADHYASEEIEICNGTSLT